MATKGVELLAVRNVMIDDYTRVICLACAQCYYRSVFREKRKSTVILHEECNSSAEPWQRPLCICLFVHRFSTVVQGTLVYLTRYIFEVPGIPFFTSNHVQDTHVSKEKRG